MKTDDLAPLMVAPKADGPSQAVSFRQGTITAFNQITLENTVVMGGTVLTDLPLLGVGESTLLTPGSVVGLLVVGSGATKTVAILGRLVTPDTDDAANAVSLESSRTYVATVHNADFTTRATFGDIANVGPSVDVVIGPSGRALVTLAAKVSYGAINGTAGGTMGYAVSGASTVAADDTQALTFLLQDTNGQTTVINAACRVLPIEGLTPGVNTFTAKYLANDATNGVTFSWRTITVQAL